VYGKPASVPVDEGAPLAPTNVYAATKAASEALVREFSARHGAAVTILRPANQIGPRQHPGLAASGFAKQIAEAEAGLAKPIVRHGDLRSRRDLLDVRDMADAYARAADIEGAGMHLFNVGTGRAVSIATVLGILMELARVPMRDELDPDLVRGTPTNLALDATRFREHTGWTATTSLRTSLADTLEYWRALVVHGVTA
jgi:GDP-4-dehydro-6-deoxy-D-mannose reductase